MQLLGGYRVMLSMRGNVVLVVLGVLHGAIKRKDKFSGQIYGIWWRAAHNNRKGKGHSLGEMLGHHEDTMRRPSRGVALL